MTETRLGEGGEAETRRVLVGMQRVPHRDPGVAKDLGKERLAPLAGDGAVIMLVAMVGTVKAKMLQWRLMLEAALIMLPQLLAVELVSGANAHLQPASGAKGHLQPASGAKGHLQPMAQHAKRDGGRSQAVHEPKRRQLMLVALTHNRAMQRPMP